MFPCVQTFATAILLYNVSVLGGLGFTVEKMQCLALPKLGDQKVKTDGLVSATETARTNNQSFFREVHEPINKIHQPSPEKEFHHLH